VMKSDGPGLWSCDNDAGGAVYGIRASGGLSIDGSSNFYIQNCPPGEIMKSTGVNAWACALDGGAAGGDTDWVENGGNVYRVNGNVGIGSNPPTEKLHVSSATDPTILLDPAGAGGVNPTIFLADNFAAAGFELRYDNVLGATYFDNRFAGGNGDMFFRTQTAGVAIDAMEIESAGNVFMKRDLVVEGNNLAFTGSHDRCTIDMWTPGNGGHCIGTSAFVNEYGPRSTYASTVIHKFHTYQDEVALQIGDTGGGGAQAGRNNVIVGGELEVQSGVIKSGGDIIIQLG